MKLNPQQMLDFVNMDGGGRSGYAKTLLDTPLTPANCLGFPLLQAGQGGDMPASIYWRMIDFVCSDLETELELCDLRDMTRISSGKHVGHQLLWGEQNGKPESTDRWTMRLNSVLEFIQPRLTMLNKQKHFPDDDELAQLMYRAIKFSANTKAALLSRFLKSTLIRKQVDWKEATFSKITELVNDARG